MVECFKSISVLSVLSLGSGGVRDGAEGLISTRQAQCWSPLTWALNSCDMSCSAQIMVDKVMETMCFLSKFQSWAIKDHFNH